MVERGPKRKVLTRDEFLRGVENKRFIVQAEMIVTPAVTALARQQGIELVVADSTARADEADPRARMIVDTVYEVLGELAARQADPVDVPAGFEGRPKLYGSVHRSLEERAVGQRAVVTTTGFNRPGIVAMLTHTIAQLGVDILDISQTIISDFFTMIIVADLEGTRERGLSFRQFKDELEASAHALGVEIMVVHEDILNAMHRI
ncbi:MAG: ACT domain-containing protein [Myxococcales bacterium]|nr:ACT domain-containing protein [Myxococcales bacterium]